MVLDLGQLCPVFLRSDDLAVVFLADGFGKILCPADLVVAFILPKPNGKGFVHVRNGCYIAGIHAGGQETAHLHVCDFMRLDGIVENVGDLVYPVLQLGFVVRIELDLPVAPGGQLAVGVSKIMGSRQFVYVLEKSLLCGGILKCQIIFEGCFVQLLFEVGMHQKALDFRAEQEAFPHDSIVQGLDAEKVPCPEQFLFHRVPDHEAEHAPQPGQQLRSVFLVAVNQHLGIGLGAEHMPCRQQILPDVLVVVDLPVEHQHLGAVLVVDGLIPLLGNVDDAQPPVPQCNVPIHIAPCRIRPPVTDLIHHILNDPVGIVNVIGKPGVSAHSSAS